MANLISQASSNLLSSGPPSQLLPLDSVSAIPGVSEGHSLEALKTIERITQARVRQLELELQLRAQRNP